MKTIKILLLLLAFSLPGAALAGDDAGLNASAAVEKKINKKTSIEFETEFRSRNDFRTADRVSLGLSGSYRPVRWLKLGVGYQLLIDNNREKITYNPSTVDDNGDEVINYNNWRPSYWGLRHRATVSLTGSYKVGRVGLSLREAWRYTYRPEKTVTRYDFDNNWWEDDRVREKHSHVLRSRLKVDWDIARCKVDPWASVELFNNLSLEKVRYTIGADYSLRKRHTFTLYYRYQNHHQSDSDTPDRHMIGLGYKFKL